MTKDGSSTDKSRAPAVAALGSALYVWTKRIITMLVFGWKDFMPIPKTNSHFEEYDLKQFERLLKNIFNSSKSWHEIE